MNIAFPVSSEVNGVEFSIYTTEEIKKLSVQKISDPITFDVFNQPKKLGLSDPALGATQDIPICGTCNLGFPACPGHFGSIELPVPVINTLFFEEVMRLLRNKCFFCHHFLLHENEKTLYSYQLQLLRNGLVKEAKSLEDIKSEELVFDSDECIAEDMESDEVAAKSQFKPNLSYIAQLKERFDSIMATCRPIKRLTNAAQAELDILKSKLLNSGSSLYRCKSCTKPKANLRSVSYYKVLYAGLAGKQDAQLEVPDVIQCWENHKQYGLNNHAELELEGFMKNNLDRSTHKEKGDIEVSSDEDNSTSDEESIDNEDSVIETGDDVDELNDGEPATDGKTKTALLTPYHILAHISLLFEKESSLINGLYCGSGFNEAQLADPKMFFYEVIPVPPNRFRPSPFVNGRPMENSQSSHLSSILNANLSLMTLAKANPGNDTDTKMKIKKFTDAWLDLQRCANGLIDSGRGMGATGKLDAPSGIKHLLEKKEGLFRMNMMGKRVNYSARSVISPDVNLESHEIGLPPVFATKLTYPEPVTAYNAEKLQAAVIRGPSEWPGATHVQNEDGSLIQLDSLTVESRTALAYQLLSTEAPPAPRNNFCQQGLGSNKRVYRHIENGDYVLFNRQPTLHKPSIMAHKVRILPGEKTVRMHYANCNTYNADFDGDEMNVHFPQNEVARAEAMVIANTDNQYLVPTSGDPLRGLIQDHVAVAVSMTSRDAFFTREEYMQLLYGSLRPEDEPLDQQRILTLAPAIFKPQKLWTGKQIISTIMLNITQGKEPLNLRSKTRVAAKYWEGAAPEDGMVTFCNGEFVTGILDKSQFGASAFGLVHTTYELYGPPMAGKLLGILGRLFTKYCQHFGFTCRMDDLRLTQEGDIWRKELIKNSTVAGQEATTRYIGLAGREKYANFSSDFALRMEEVYRDNEKLQGLDATMKSKMNGITSSIIDKCIPHGLFKKFPENHMQAMTVSGAKGSNVNVSQISCLLGQQELEGRRVPLMISGKTLPSFQPFETSARAGGFISGRFLTGIKPQEYFFHCMAGREGLIDTAVKTANSGYLQRCLIKHLEGLRVHYDNTVRDNDGSILQFQYGEDSLDVIKQKHLTQFRFAAENYRLIKQNHHPGKAIQHIDGKKARDHFKRALRNPHKYPPALSLYSPSRYHGSVSEKFHMELEKYLSSNPDKILWDDDKKTTRFPGEVALNKERFRALMQLKYMQSVVEPGEAVGLLAAQSVGEPSTQMTLNTFHFAGFGAKNVTLGIPRLREIVMTASKFIRTPSMTLTIRDEVSDKVRDNFCRWATKLRLSEIMNEVEVTENIATTTDRKVMSDKEYRILLRFFPEVEYGPEFDITRKLVLKSMTSFVKKLMQLVNVALKWQGGKIKALSASRKKDGDGEEEDGLIENIDDMLDDGEDNSDSEEDGSEDEDEDAKQAARKAQNADYGQYEDSGDDGEAVVSDMEDGDKAKENKPKKTKRPTIDNEDEDSKSMDTLMEKYDELVSFRFDKEAGGWAEFVLRFPRKTKKILMVGIAEEACRKTIVRQIDDIDRVFPIINEVPSDPRRLVASDGINLKKIWQFGDIIEVDTIDTNDIYGVCQAYGIEAGRNAIKKEIGSVFAVYGIEVDHRHLTLIADYMTFEGIYKAFNRMSLATNTAPFQQMSFETTISFLKKSALSGALDDMISPSSKLVLGKLIEGGTGSFKLLQPLPNSASIATAN